MPGARDGQLRIHRGADSPPWALQLFDDDLGIWLTLAQANEEDEAMAQGIPVLRGPYMVDYTELPTDGATKVLWTPAVGDVLLRLFADWRTVTQWDQGDLHVGVNPTSAAENQIALGYQGQITLSAPGGLDSLADGIFGLSTDGTGVAVRAWAQVFNSTDPIGVYYANPGGIAPAQGHVELYALVCRAIAP